MARVFEILSQAIGRALADHPLPALILGVVGAAFFFAIVLGADASIVFGVLVIGCVTAFIEGAHRRD
jgi:hypothetical protein